MSLAVSRVKKVTFGSTVYSLSTSQSTGLSIAETSSVTPIGGGGSIPQIGIYTSGNNTSSASTRGDPRYPSATVFNTPLDALTASWPTKPNHVSFYMNWNSSPVPTNLRTYATQGRSIQVSWSTKISAGNFALWDDITAGTYDAHLISIINAYDALGVEVCLALDIEPDNPSNPGVGQAAGQTSAQYVAAANHLGDLIHANSTHVKFLVWLTGSCTLAWLPDATRLDYVGWDPYKRGDDLTDTPTTMFQKAVTTILNPHGYNASNGIKYMITETGIKTDPFSSGGVYTVTDEVNFYQAIPQAFIDIPLLHSVIWFRANSGTHNYIPAPDGTTTVDDSFRDMIDATYG